MSRHEEKEDALNSVLPIPPEGETYAIKNQRHGFNIGASWADENPRKGLVDIGKVCEWLEPILKSYAGYNCGSDLLNDFRKAMQDE